MLHLLHLIGEGKNPFRKRVRDPILVWITIMKMMSRD